MVESKRVLEAATGFEPGAGKTEPDTVGREGAKQRKTPPATGPLISLPWREATVQKWESGRLLYGGDWVGLHPLQELYAELIDSINYVREWASRPGADLDFCLRQQTRLAELADETRAQWMRIEGGE